MLALLFPYLVKAETTRAGCHWVTGHGGEFLQCMPNYYIQGACESNGNLPECKVGGGGIGKAVGTAIYCCPTTDDLNFSQRTNCIKIGQHSGHNLICPYETAAFGRCFSTSKGIKFY